MEAKEFKIPLILTVVGLALLEIQLVAVENLSAVESIKLLAIFTVVRVAMGILAFYLAAQVFGIAFGTLGLASLKLAATILFSNAVSSFIPIAGADWVVAFVIYCSLLIWFFELEGNEFVWVLVSMFVANFVANLIIASVVVGMTS